MSTPNKYEPQANTPAPEPVPLPCCPHCGKDIASPLLYNWFHAIEAPAPGLPRQVQVILSVYCPALECRRMLHTQVMMVQEDVTEPRIQRPH